ncbi:MAG TPA: alkaline phosphatase family protein [Actinomycetota bacterium]|jgi:predicted AlkP superfamily phosphohydrolase/phosphomutase|nr:alkaline phosphatase family protein [Actinomycetota bacterium]
MQQGPRVAVIGLDCATPQLLFHDLQAEVPNIAKLMGEGAYGNLASITPPITVPAWACAMTGKVPGQLGIYGFRNRKDTTYDGLAIAHSGSIKEPAVWDKLGEQGMRTVLIGVPPSFPPPKEFPGWRVGCFLTPPSAERWAYPQPLEAEIEEELEGKNYIFDIPNFRQAGMEVTLDQVFKMTERRFQVGRRLIQNKPWDFFMLCDIALDRLHHVFWQYFDPRHPLYQPGNAYEATFRDYYRFLDQQVGTLLELIPDDAITMVMSDHGARPMMGGLCFNDWLIQEQYLTLAEPVSQPTPIKEASIDWSRTIAWGDGGYYGRLFLNVKGREPQGIVEPANYEATRDELIAKLESAPGPDGQPLGTKVLKPQDVYPEVRGIAPDLIVYFGDLEWRSVGAVGNPSIYTYENDTGPDGANHDRDGIFIVKNAPGQPMGEVSGWNLVDVGPTILSLYGIDATLEGAVGRSFL